MKRACQILHFLTLIVVSTSYSAEVFKKIEDGIEPIIIKNLDTQICPALAALEARVNLETMSYTECSLKLYANISPSPLIFFLQQKFDPYLLPLHVKFYPTIIRYRTKGTLENLGTLNGETEHYAKRACRLGQALFIPFMQGAIVYHSANKVEKDDVIYTNIMKKIQEVYTMILDNQRNSKTLLKQIRRPC